jgi:hypothetical protein
MENVAIVGIIGFGQTQHDSGRKDEKKCKQKKSREKTSC